MDYKERPIFISGVAKSGTSLLLSLIDGHKKILAYPEEPSFHKVIERNYPDLERLVHDWIECYSVLGVRKNILLNRMKNMGYNHVSDYPDYVLEDISEKDIAPRLLGVKDSDFDFNKYKQTLRYRLRNISEKKDIMLSSIEAIAVAAGVEEKLLEHWAYKETFNSKSKSKIDFLFNTFEKPRILFITRDPRSWYNSRKKSHIKQNQYHTYNGIFYPYKMITEMKKSHHLFLKLQKKYGEESIHITRYEDLITNISDEIDKIFQFLKMKPHSLNNIPTKLGKILDVHTSPKNMDGSKIFKDSLVKWKSDLGLYDKVNIYLFTFTYFLKNNFGYQFKYKK